MIFIDLCTSEMHSRPLGQLPPCGHDGVVLRPRLLRGEPQLACERRVKRYGQNSAKALRSDTKADLLSSAPPPVMAEALQLNEETVTSGRQLIARPAGKYAARANTARSPTAAPRETGCSMRYSQRKINLLHLLTLVQFTEAFLPHASPRLLRPPCAVKHVLARLPVEDVSGGGDGGDGGGDGIQQWLQTNVLQGVALTPTTYSIMVVYFVQGALGLAALARTYFLKDQLGLAPAEQAALMGVSTLPWVIKPVYGFLTDGLPIFGLRRKPYLVIGGLLGASAWAALATVVETPLQVEPGGPTHMHAHGMFMSEGLRTRRGGSTHAGGGGCDDRLAWRRHVGCRRRLARGRERAAPNPSTTPNPRGSPGVAEALA